MSMFGVFVGRFQPLHRAHMEIIDGALRAVDTLLILIGSTNVAPNTKNPFTYEERVEIFKKAYRREISSGRIIIKAARDYFYSDLNWQMNVQKIVYDTFGESDDINLIGFAKDSTSYYLKLFPQWNSIPLSSSRTSLSSTDIRRRIYANDWSIEDMVHPAVFDMLRLNKDFNERYSDLREEFNFETAYYKDLQRGPYPVIVQAVDSVVVQGGHVLLIKRKDRPGKGLLALPGGHVGEFERLSDAAIRELTEETKIKDRRGKIPPKVLQSYIKEQKTFDNPGRSNRARVITTAFLIQLPETTQLFEVTGGDDAESAHWVPISNLRNSLLFEDHGAILEDMLDISLMD